jgi:drug/metabolite transporter (DMT)-like permease
MTQTAVPRALDAPGHRVAPSARVVWAALLVVYVVWGSTYLAIRVMVENGLPPLLSGGTRFVTAGAILAVAVAVRQGPAALRVGPRQLAAAALVGGLLLLGGNGLVSIGEQTVPSGLAALLIAATPLWIVLLRSGLGDRPRRLTLAGVLLGFAGLAILVLPGGSGGATNGGIALILLAALLWATGSVLSPRLPMPSSPFVATTWEMLLGGAVMIVVAVGRGEAGGLRLAEIEPVAWYALGYLVVFGSLAAFSAYVWLLANAPISLAATYAYVNPVVAVLLGALLLAEPVTAAVLAGGAVTVLGVLLVVRSERGG